MHAATMSFSQLAPDVLLRVMKIVASAPIRVSRDISPSDYCKAIIAAVDDVLVCERTCRALRTAAKDDAVWQCFWLIHQTKDGEYRGYTIKEALDLRTQTLSVHVAAAPAGWLDRVYTKVEDGHRMCTLHQRALHAITLEQIHAVPDESGFGCEMAARAAIITLDVFDGPQQYDDGDLLTQQYRTWLKDAYLHFNAGVLAGMPREMMLTSRAAELLASVIEHQMIEFMGCCLLSALHRLQPHRTGTGFDRDNPLGAEFELTKKDIFVTWAIQHSGLTFNWRDVQSQCLLPHAGAENPLVIWDNDLCRKLILRLSHAAAIPRMSAECFQTFFDIYQAKIAPVLLRAGLVLASQYLPNAAEDAAGYWSFSSDDEEDDEDAGEDGETDSDAGDSESDAESDEPEWVETPFATDPSDETPIDPPVVGVDGPNRALVADRELINELLRTRSEVPALGAGSGFSLKLAV